MRYAFTLLALLAVSPVQAACYADYKAKQDNPLRLHYGVADVPQNACTAGAAAQVLAPRLARAGWQLLNILSVFDDRGLAARKDNAGEFFRRY